MELTSTIAQVFSLWCIVLPVMLLGCLAGNWLQGTLIWRACARLMGPMTLRMKLPYDCSLYFAICFLNYYAANAFLGVRFREGRLSEKQLLVAFLIGGFPTSLHYAIFYIAPILITAAGWFVGCVYTVLYLMVSLITALVGVLIGILYPNDKDLFAEPEDREEKHIPNAPPRMKFKIMIGTSLRQFVRIAIVFVPITFFLTLVLHSEHFQTIWQSFDTLLRKVGLSPAVVIVIASGVTSSIAALATAGSLFKGQLLGSGEMVIALLTAYGLHTVYDLLFNYLPSNIAFFGPQIGIRVSVVNNLIRILSITIIIGIIFVLVSIAR